MKKLIAGFMTAMLSLLAVASPALAASMLGDYPSFLEDAAGALDAYVVVGSAAAVDDVVGAIDIAVRLAEVGKESVSQACAGASGDVDGTSKDSCFLSGALSSCFPSSAVLKTAHFSGLADSTYTWRANEYDYREQVSFAGVAMSHDLAVTNVNGTETMIVESEDVKYQLVFEEQLTGLGSAATPNYTYPVKISMLGQEFQIVGTSAANTVRVLQGSIGTVTATTGLTFGDYTAYSDLGSNGAWARIVIKDADGNTVDTLLPALSESLQSSAAGLTVMPTAINALMDGTIVGVDLVMGDSTAGIDKTYDVTADTTSTGTASDLFPGETAWGIQVGSSSFGTTAGTIQVNDILEVVYKPTSVLYLKAGEKISLPNDVAELGFQGWNTDKFVSVTVKPLSGTVSAYWFNETTTVLSNLNGIEISADVSGSLISQTGLNAYSKAYVLFNYTSKDSANFAAYPVMIGFYDPSNQKILVNGTFLDVGDAQGVPEYLSAYLNASSLEGIDQVTYPITVCYSNACDDNHILTITVTAQGRVNVNAGNTTDTTNIVMEFRNKTDIQTASSPSWQLGPTAATAETVEINMTTEGSSRQAGKTTQEIVDDSGIITENTNSNGGSETIVLQVPFKALRAKLYFGKLGGGVVSGDSVTYDSFPSIPITSAVAKLDSEIGAAEKAKNIISVGGSCVNSITAEALGLTYPTCGADSTIPEDKALISVVDDAFTADKVVVVVAGWEATNTRTASTVLQQFDTLLSGVTASAVEVTSATSAGISPA